jgi:putative phosphoesterase
MRLAIISDTHDNLAWLDKVMDWLADKHLDGLVHCGDVQSIETLVYLCQRCSVPVWVAYDPHTDGLEALVRHQQAWPVILKAVHEKIEIPEAGLAAVHKPDAAEHLAATGAYRYVCHGHTHVPWEKRHGSVRVFCPGNLCGVRARPTFATLDTDTDDLQLHVVETL